MTNWSSYHKEKFLEIPEDVRERGADVLRDILDEQTRELIFEEWRRERDDWCVPYHFYWGMAIRNALRDAGLFDDRLPDKNWDDYYIPLVEYAIGIRTVSGDYKDS